MKCGSCEARRSTCPPLTTPLLLCIKSRCAHRYFNSLDASLRKQTELESLRAQIRDASTVELKEREDLERLKKQLAAEREIGGRRERDFETQRGEWDDEIARLQVHDAWRVTCDS